MQQRKIPVFLHIPKNAGTYVLGWTMTLFRYYGITKDWNDKVGWNYNLRRILLQHENKQISTLFVYDPHKVRESNQSFAQHPTNKYCNIVQLQNFLEELKNKKLTLFSVIVEADGVHYIKENLYNGICELDNSHPLYYTIFRDTYNRSESLYNYINSSKSLHEPTHNTFKSKTFSEYLNSYELEDCWLIRKLINITGNEIINEEIFNRACAVLDDFKIKDIKHTDELIDDVFTECYNISQNIVSTNDKNVFKNSTSSDTFVFDDLDYITRDVFLERTRFDRKLYNKYCK